MAGILSKVIDQGKFKYWVFDTLPTDVGVSLGVQPGDLMFETTGSHLYTVDNSHASVLLSQ